jgi:hypothetical protein
MSVGSFQQTVMLELVRDASVGGGGVGGSIVEPMTIAADIRRVGLDDPSCSHITRRKKKVTFSQKESSVRYMSACLPV